MGDRICILKDGEIMQVGRPLEVYDNPQNIFVARFLSSPPMNILEASLNEGRITCPLGQFALSPGQISAYAGAQGRALKLGLRAEDLHATPGTGRIPVSAELRAIEALGAENILFAQITPPPDTAPQGSPTGGIVQEIAARVDRRMLPAVGDRITLYLDTAAIHLFDAISEQAFVRPDPDEVRV